MTHLTFRNKRNLLFAIALLFSLPSMSQDRIFSIGYTKNFISSDSSNVSFTIDLNRIPGKSEGPGTFYLINIPALEKLNFFVKPTADVNLGSYTTLTANNVSIGLPLGFSRKLNKDTPNTTWGTLWGSFEIGPDFIADKTFNNYLYYLSPGFALNYSYTSTNETVVDFGVGFKYGFGKRLQSVETKATNSYGKYVIPIGLALNAFKAKDDSYHHLKLSGIYKYNHILKDELSIGTGKDKNYLQFKLDYYFMSQLGINVTYTSGYEEPLFKKVNSLAFGITFARKG
ncbi:hypothetical protein SAMN05421827_101516 [Pedobacter terrae]|uniref:Outer membrane protein with beta-barrel domain n=1 Tax=Pedobacter terrae TaxID=405671 RepID=A0A1G7NV58_9SPHI|nr:hypothetical protein [Pedobacter terrae]SDF77902.1 hypothetical protein SAMN05421827_101516 [Pedobacter terrae]